MSPSLSLSPFILHISFVDFSGKQQIEQTKDRQGEGMHMLLCVHTLNHQHNHFLGIPFERQREFVCVCEREQKKGNQEDMGVTVCVTRPLFVQRPDTHAHTHASCHHYNVCGALLLINCFTFLLYNCCTCVIHFSMNVCQHLTSYPITALLELWTCNDPHTHRHLHKTVLQIQGRAFQ